MQEDRKVNTAQSVCPSSKADFSHLHDPDRMDDTREPQVIQFPRRQKRLKVWAECPTLRMITAVHGGMYHPLGEVTRSATPGSVTRQHPMIPASPLRAKHRMFHLGIGNLDKNGFLSVCFSGLK
jgi:hypothetical protein